MLILKIIILMAGWFLFYTILQAKKIRAPKLKATLITLLFASLFTRVALDFYASIMG